MGRMARFVRAALAVLAVLAVLAAGYLLGRARRPPQEPRVDSAPVVMAVRRIAKLATVEMELSDVVKVEEVRTIAFVDIPKNATLRVRGRVQAGFDLASGLSISAEEVSKTLRIRLPAPQVVSIDPRIEWFDERSGWLNPITPADRTRWTEWARTSLARAAKDAGILPRASNYATEIFTETAKAFGWRAVVTVEGVSTPKL